MSLYNTFIEESKFFTFGKYRGYPVQDVLFGNNFVEEAYAEGYFYHRLKNFLKVMSWGRVEKPSYFFNSSIPESFKPWIWTTGQGSHLEGRKFPHSYLQEGWPRGNFAKSEGKLLTMHIHSSENELDLIRTLEFMVNTPAITYYCDSYTKFFRNDVLNHPFHRSLVKKGEMSPEFGYFNFINFLKKQSESTVLIPKHIPVYKGLSDYDYIFWCISNQSNFILNPLFLDLLDRIKIYKFDSFKFDIRRIIRHSSTSLLLIKVVPVLTEEVINVPAFMKEYNCQKMNKAIEKHLNVINNIHDTHPKYKDSDYYEIDAIQNALDEQQGAEDEYRYNQILADSTDEAITNSLYEGDPSNRWNVE